MKTKLLKKIRKRFEILHYPDGQRAYLLGEPYHLHMNGCVELNDKENELDKTWAITSKRDLSTCINKAKERILDHYRLKFKKNLSTSRPIKLWHI